MSREAERKRLIELLSDHTDNAFNTSEEKRFIETTTVGEVADHLLDNGVIVPPCKVGDKVYKIVDMSHTACNSFITKETVEPYAVIYANVMGGYSCIPFEAFGKTVFLSEAEAKYALKNRRSVSLVNGHIEE